MWKMVINIKYTNRFWVHKYKELAVDDFCNRHGYGAQIKLARYLLCTTIMTSGSGDRPLPQITGCQDSMTRLSCDFGLEEACTYTGLFLSKIIIIFHWAASSWETNIIVCHTNHNKNRIWTIGACHTIPARQIWAAASTLRLHSPPNTLCVKRKGKSTWVLYCS